MELKAFVCDYARCKVQYILTHNPGQERYAELLLERKHFCPVCGTGHLHPSFTDLEEYVNRRMLSFKDLWFAVNGVGLPEDRDFDVATVAGLLVKYPIVSSELALRRTGRVEVMHITLKNGSRLFFGEGACIFKIEEVKDGWEGEGIRDKNEQESGEECTARSSRSQGGDVAEDG
jgi:hypothetical protein